MTSFYPWDTKVHYPYVGSRRNAELVPTSAEKKKKLGFTLGTLCQIMNK